MIDVSLDAYGWTGPWARRRGFDSLVQMSSGIAAAGMAAAGAEAPVPLPVQALDHATGYLLATARCGGSPTVTAMDEAHERGSHWPEPQRCSRDGETAMVNPESIATPPTITDDDYLPTLEHTDWGPARRLRPPVQLGDHHAAVVTPRRSPRV